MTPETEQISADVPAADEPQAQPQLVPSDYATGFVAGYLRSQGIVGRQPTVPEFREALTELSQHMAEIRSHAH